MEAALKVKLGEAPVLVTLVRAQAIQEFVVKSPRAASIEWNSTAEQGGCRNNASPADGVERKEADTPASHRIRRQNKAVAETMQVPPME